MAVVSCDEIPGAQVQLDTDKGERNYTRLFRVVTNSRLDDGVQLLALVGGDLPARGDFYTSTLSGNIDTGAWVKKIDPQQDRENPKIWEVRVEYGPGEPPAQNPLDRPAKYSWGKAKFTKPAIKDRDGNAVMNSAKVYYDPPAEMDDSRRTLTIVRNEASYDAARSLDYEDAVNAAAFMGFARNCVKVEGITATSESENGFNYWTVTYEFHMRRDTWTLSLLDQGRHERIAGKLVPIKDRMEGGGKADTFVTDPVPLDGAGRELANPTPANAKYNDHDVYQERSFSVFNF